MDGFLTMTELQRLLGRNPRTVQKWIAAQGVRVFLDPLDGRRRLVKEAEVRKLTRPQEIKEVADAIAS